MNFKIRLLTKDKGSKVGYKINRFLYCIGVADTGLNGHMHFGITATLV